MDLRHHAGPLADGRADALDRSGTHIADGEHARDVRLERRRSVASVGRPGIVWSDVGAGPHEALGVKGDGAILEPLRRGIHADEDEDIADRLLGFRCNAPPIRTGQS